MLECMRAYLSCICDILAYLEILMFVFEHSRGLKPYVVVAVGLGQSVYWSKNATFLD